MIHDHIGRIDDEVVVRNADDCHNQSAEHCAQDSAAAGFLKTVYHTGHADKQSAHHKIKQLPHRSGAGAGQFDQVFDQAHHNTGNRAVSKAGNQSWQFRNIQLDKGGHDGNGKLHIHQYCGNGSKHGGSG